MPSRITAVSRKTFFSSVRFAGVVVLALGLSTQAEAGKKKKGKEKEAPAAEAAEEKAPAAAEDAMPEIVLPCNWEEGLEFTYDYTRRRSDSRNPMLEQVETGATLSVTVTGSGNPSRFSYAVSEPTVNGPEEAINAVAALMDAADSLPAMQLVMTDGSLSRIENFKEVSDALWEAMVEPLKSSGATEDIVTQTEAMVKNPQTGTAMVMKEPSQFFSMHCIGLNDGQVIEAETAYPNPLGGAPIPGSSRIALTENNLEAQQITIETLDRTSPEALKNVMKEAVTQFGGSDLSEEELAARIEKIKKEMPPIDNVITGKMVYSTADGFPLSIQLTQEIGSADGPIRMVDTRSWTRKAAEAE